MENLKELLEEELIHQIGDPILEQLFEIESQMGHQLTGKAIRIELLQADGRGPGNLAEFYNPSGNYSEDEMDVIESILHNGSFLKKLEAYLQQQVETWHEPVILH